MTELAELIHELITLETELTTLFGVAVVVVVVEGWFVVLVLQAAPMAPIAVIATAPAAAARRRGKRPGLMMSPIRERCSRLPGIAPSHLKIAEPEKHSARGHGLRPRHLPASAQSAVVCSPEMQGPHSLEALTDDTPQSRLR